VAFDELDDAHTFDSARSALLDSFSAELNLPLHKIVQEYQDNTEFKRRMDMAAMDMANPRSRAIH
jgi:hypothetical protein